MRSLIAFLCLVLFLSCAPAEPQDTVLFSSNAGECTLSAESNDQWHTLRLRAHHPSGKNCLIDQGAMASVLGTALSNADSAKFSGKFNSLFIGRLIDYPWLSQALAVAASKDRGWDRIRGKPMNKDINGYVAKILAGRDMAAPLNAALAKAHYKVKSITVEKVLVGRFRDVPLYRDKTAAALVPYDAQVWYRLAIQ